MSKQIVRVIEEHLHHVVTSGSQGLRGAQGDIGPSGGSAFSAISNVPIGGNRFVVSDGDGHVQYATSDDLTHAGKVLGITLGAAVAGDSISIQRVGEVEEAGWNWTLDQPVYLGTNGLATQTQPTSVFSLIVGFPITATKLFVSIREPIIF